MSKADSPTKKCQPCTESGEARPMRAHVDGVPLCATHYNRTRYTAEQRHPKHRITCVACGQGWDSSRPDGKYCSDDCRAVDYVLRGIQPEPAMRGVGGWSRRTRAKHKLAKAARGNRGCRWVAGHCPRCGNPFVSALGADLGRYCSNACKHRTKSSRRRARERGADHQPYSRVAIFERDGYRCHLCRELTIPTAVVPHPRAPVIDHLIPLGPGADAPHNVATACFLCNSKRRDVGPAQLMLFG